MSAEIFNVTSLQFTTTKNPILIILAYHRVADPNQEPLLNPRLISALPSQFEAQMSFLAANYTVVSVESVLDCMAGGRALPKRAVLITFDDAYFDFPDYAWSILRKHRLPVVVFVPTAFPGKPKRAFWWDKLHAAVMQTDRYRLVNPTLGELNLAGPKHRLLTLKLLQSYVKSLDHRVAMEFVDETCRNLGYANDIHRSTMDWDELRRLAREGVTLGAHTCNHPLLTRVSLDEARREVSESCADLNSEIGRTLPIFAYPNGSYNGAIQEILKHEGLIGAFAVDNKINNIMSADPLALARINITRRTSPMLFRLRLNRWFCRLDAWRRHIRQV